MRVDRPVGPAERTCEALSFLCLPPGNAGASRKTVVFSSANTAQRGRAANYREFTDRSKRAAVIELIGDDVRSKICLVVLK